MARVRHFLFRKVRDARVEAEAVQGLPQVGREFLEFAGEVEEPEPHRPRFGQREGDPPDRR